MSLDTTLRLLAKASAFDQIQIKCPRCGKEFHFRRNILIKMFCYKSPFTRSTGKPFPTFQSKPVFFQTAFQSYNSFITWKLFSFFIIRITR